MSIGTYHVNLGEPLPVNMDLAPTLPLVTVIMPVRNEAAHIQRSLGSVLQQDYPASSMEILVVDGMSADATRDLVRELATQHPERDVRLLDNPRRIAPSAMNIGVSASRGSLLIRLDGHAVYPPDYVRLCVDASRLSGADNVGGVFVGQADVGGASAELVSALTTHRFGVGDATYRLGAQAGFTDTVPYGCYRREVFDKIGRFDERLARNQDYELNRRLLKCGGSIWLDPRIRVLYYNQRTLSGLFRQSFLNGKWNAWTWWVAPYAFASRHAIPALFVLWLITVVLANALLALPAWFLPTVLAPYILLSIGSSLQQARRLGTWMAPVLPLLFLAHHSSYGVGTLWGLVLLGLRRAPVQRVREPWAGAGRYRAWPAIAGRSG